MPRARSRPSSQTWRGARRERVRCHLADAARAVRPRRAQRRARRSVRRGARRRAAPDRPGLRDRLEPALSGAADPLAPSTGCASTTTRRCWRPHGRPCRIGATVGAGRAAATAMVSLSRGPMARSRSGSCSATSPARLCPNRDGAAGLSASALLDLTSAAWLDRLAAWCRGMPVLMALSFDGRLGFEPAAPEDRTIRERFVAHQRSDKGFGPALGPDAAPYLADRLAACGHEVALEPADWRLGPEDRPLLGATLEGIVRAAREMANDSSLERWATLAPATARGRRSAPHDRPSRPAGVARLRLPGHATPGTSWRGAQRRTDRAPAGRCSAPACRRGSRHRFVFLAARAR